MWWPQKRTQHRSNANSVTQHQDKKDVCCIAALIGSVTRVGILCWFSIVLLLLLCLCVLRVAG